MGLDQRDDAKPVGDRAWFCDGGQSCPHAMNRLCEEVDVPPRIVPADAFNGDAKAFQYLIKAVTCTLAPQAAGKGARIDDSDRTFRKVEACAACADKTHVKLQPAMGYQEIITSETGEVLKRHICGTGIDDVGICDACQNRDVGRNLAPWLPKRRKRICNPAIFCPHFYRCDLEDVIVA